MSETTGQKIKRIRKERGISQKKLSDLSGIHVSQLSRYEKDINSPSLDILIKISKALGVTLYTLKEFEFDKESFSTLKVIDPNKNIVCHVDIKKQYAKSLKMILDGLFNGVIEIRATIDSPIKDIYDVVIENPGATDEL